LPSCRRFVRLAQRVSRTIAFALMLLTGISGTQWIGGGQVFNSANAANISGEIGPSEVFALWQEINRAILIYADAYGVSDAVKAQMLTVEPEAYQDKMPSDVFARVNGVRGDLTQVLGDWNELNYHGGALLEAEMMQYLTLDGNMVTPLTVYLHSVFLLDSLIKSILVINPQFQNVSQFFAEQEVEPRKPGDVYILVGMAQKRITLLLGAVRDQGPGNRP